VLRLSHRIPTQRKSQMTDDDMRQVLEKVELAVRRSLMNYPETTFVVTVGAKGAFSINPEHLLLTTLADNLAKIARSLE